MHQTDHPTPCQNKSTTVYCHQVKLKPCEPLTSFGERGGGVVKTMTWKVCFSGSFHNLVVSCRLIMSTVASHARALPNALQKVE